MKKNNLCISAGVLLTVINISNMLKRKRGKAHNMRSKSVVGPDSRVMTAETKFIHGLN